MSFLQSLIDAVALGAVYGVVALGIGLVFGVMRLVNFAYGELITAGGYTLALSRAASRRSSRSSPASPSSSRSRSCRSASPSGRCAAPRRRRCSSPPSRSASCSRTSTCSRSARAARRSGTLGGLNTAIAVGSLRIRWISIVARRRRRASCSAATALLLNRTTIGLQIRAAAADFRTARILGVRANRVIAFSFLDLGLPRRGRRGAADRPVAARHARLRRAGDDLRARRGGRRRPRPALDGDARRLRDRLRDLVRRRPAAVVEQRLPAVGDLRARDPRPPPAARAASSPAPARRAAERV